MTIRLARASDLTAITACEDLAFGWFDRGANSRNVSSDGELARQIRHGEIHVIIKAARILGYISCSPNREHLYVTTIAVLPKYHRTGLGSRLLEFAEKAALGLGKTSVRLFTDGKKQKNITFYLRRGYRETDRLEDNGFSRVYFTKCVAPGTTTRPLIRHGRQAKALDAARAELALLE